MKSISNIVRIAILLAFVGLSSCSIINTIQFESVSIEVLSAPDSMALQKGRYVVVNRVPSTLEMLKIDTIVAGELKLDSIFYKYLSWAAINSCLDIIELSPLMDSIILDTLNHKGLAANSLSSFDPLPSSYVRDLCQRQGVDGIISLEQIHLFDSLHISPLYDTRMGDSTIWGYFALEMIFPGMKWRVYSGDGDLVYTHISKDTLTMEGVGTSKREAESKLVKEEDILYESMRIEGSSFGETIAPNWISVNRIYYTTGNKEMKDAAKLAAANDWVGAAEIWKVQAEISEDVSIRAKACFNMALASEIMDNLYLAYVWINKSWEHEKDEVTVQYSRILRSRLQMKNMITKSLIDSEN